MNESFLEKSAKLYESDLINGWEKLYIKKRLFLYNSFKSSFSGHDALELGCADGQMTKLILQDFENVTVVDGSKKFLDILKTNFKQSNINYQYSTFERFSTNSRFDAIFLCHILEHLKDPVFILKKIKNWLKSTGKVYIAVPNSQSIHRMIGVKMNLLKREDSLNEQDKKLGHLRIYSRQSLNQDIEEAGLKIIHSGGCMLKPISNRQIAKQWSDQLINAFFDIGKDFPDLCSEIYAIVSL